MQHGEAERNAFFLGAAGSHEEKGGSGIACSLPDPRFTRPIIPFSSDRSEWGGLRGVKNITKTDKARENLGHPQRNIYWSSRGHYNAFVCRVWEGETREGGSECTYKANLKKAVKPTRVQVRK